MGGGGGNGGGGGGGKERLKLKIAEDFFFFSLLKDGAGEKTDCFYIRHFLSRLISLSSSTAYILSKSSINLNRHCIILLN